MPNYNVIYDRYTYKCRHEISDQLKSYLNEEDYKRFIYDEMGSDLGVTFSKSNPSAFTFSEVGKTGNSEINLEVVMFTPEQFQKFCEDLVERTLLEERRNLK